MMKAIMFGDAIPDAKDGIAVSVQDDAICIAQLKEVDRLALLAVPEGKFSATTFVDFDKPKKD